MLMFLIILASSFWFAVSLIHAATTGVMWARYGNVSRAETPVSFWVSAIFAVVLLCLCLAAAWAVYPAAAATS